MGLKATIGKRIRAEREAQGLSRETLCGAEEELTVRQLLRIETGKSLPRLETLEFLSHTLNVDVTTFLAEEKLDIPSGYFELKYKLLKMSTYGDPVRIEEKRRILDEIYNLYLDILPEEELFTLDVLERMWDYVTNEGPSRGSSVDRLYDEYFQQLLTKEKYNANDLLLITYHFLYSHDHPVSSETLQLLAQKTMEQQVTGDELYNKELLSALLILAGSFIENNTYSQMKSLCDRMDGIIEETAQYSLKPSILVCRAKNALFFEGNAEQAQNLYGQAKSLAEAFQDEVFIQQLAQELKKDFPDTID